MKASGPSIVPATVTAQAPAVTATETTSAATAAAPAPPKFLRPQFERMPPELKPLKNWVLWVPVGKGSKWTKRPIQPSGFGASTTNPKNWSSFEVVKHAYERAAARGFIEVHEKGEPVQHLPVGGVGFVFDGQPDEDGLVYAGIDFDQIISGGEIPSFVAERVKRLGSYTEGSVSNTGVHVIVKAHPLASGISHNRIEMYTSGRFFTMTGHSNERPIIAAPDAVAALADEVRAKEAAAKQQQQSERQPAMPVVGFVSGTSSAPYARFVAASRAVRHAAAKANFQIRRGLRTQPHYFSTPSVRPDFSPVLRGALGKPADLR